ncbi:MAG: DUF222 domain-containing protein [Candidatus Nanopelagicales bacterium]|nr:DUF222 domain-containing protein [Candidatus Nanopelagicales bacterium]
MALISTRDGNVDVLGDIFGDRSADAVSVPVDWEFWDHSDLEIVSLPLHPRDVSFDTSAADAAAADAAAADAAVAGAAMDPTDLLSADPDDLLPDDAIDYLIELQRTQARLAALEARALVVVAGRTRRERQVLVHDSNGDEPSGAARILTITDEAREELAAALHRSPAAVHEQLVTARLLTGPLTGTLAALSDGSITAFHARAIADEARRLSSADGDAATFTRDCGLVEARVLPRAHSLTVGATRRFARAAVLRVDAEGQERRRAVARKTIDVHMYAEDDGLAVLLARLPLAEATRVHAALDGAARHAFEEGGATLGQRRAQALILAVCGDASAAESSPTDASAVRLSALRTSAAHPSATGVDISIVIEAGALLGITDLPATITGALGGPNTISAAAVRELLADPAIPTSLRRLLTDPVTGHLLDRGRTTYAVTGVLRDFLAARDITCRHPGCTRPAARCQVDHAIEWADGGSTDTANTGLLCIRHHQLKTHGGWQIIESRPDGSCTWQSPGGRTYDVDPPPLVCD